MGSATTVCAADLVKEYGAIRALDGVSLDLSRGVTGLVGVNGAGKSTLLMTLAGALRPGQGRVVINGTDLYARRGRRAALRQVAFVPQLPVFPKNLTAREVVSYIAWMRGINARAADKRSKESLEQVGLAKRINDKVGKLSGGMQRRVAIAQALASDAEVVLLDEPSTGLDPQQRRAMVELLAELPGTVLVSSHVMEDVADLARKVVVLDGGRLRFSGTLQALAALAPDGTPEHRRVEAGFLSLCIREGA